METAVEASSIYNLSKYFTKTGEYWMNEKKNTSLDLFQKMSRQVPAYANFLSKNNIKPEKIKRPDDLVQVPAITKENYLRQYPLHELCWQGHINSHLMYCSTSGSTGKPFYFPRSAQLDWQNSHVLENFINQSGCEGPILAVICFGMGAWIGGVLNYSAFQILQKRETRPISIIAPGINKPEILQILETIAPNYKEVILLGYPPFIKDLFDTYTLNNKLPQLFKFKLIFAAECITESFRDYICEQANIENPMRDMINIYGSADIGGMAVESAAGIALRRLTEADSKLRSEFFPTNKSATLAQYNPHFTNFDCDEGNLLVSGNSALPLFRYAIGDRGGLFSFDDVNNVCKDYGVDLEENCRSFGVHEIEKLPFVYVYERVDFSVKFFGAIIYPEYIRPAIQHKDFAHYLTGRFCIEIGENKDRDQQLVIHVELKNGIEISTETLEVISAKAKESLLIGSSEYANNASVLGNKVNPVIRSWPHGHSLYFKLGIKQSWVKKPEPVAES